MTDQMTPADRLREAARVLRERAGAATPGPWEAGSRCVWTLSDPLNARPAVIDDGHDGSGGASYAGDSEYIATMHPGVGLALADWLDDQADRAAENEAVWESGKRQYPKAWEGRTVEGNVQHHYAHPLTVADAVLGGEER